MKTKKPRKQRKSYFKAPLHKKRKMLAAHLAENLLLKYDRRSTTVVKGDSVKVMRGSFKGHEDKVASVDLKKQIVEVEGITTVKADGTKVAKPVHPSNLLITKLNLTDKWRRKKLEKGLSEDAKKEIEKEAEDQIKEIEKIKEEEKAKAGEEEDISEEEPKPKEEPVKKEVKKKEKVTTKKDEEKPISKKATKTKKQVTTKKPEKKESDSPKKKSMKKVPKKTTSKNEEKK
jgi:large subunit ribosomal protein L24